jgi:hypothetical protein
MADQVATTLRKALGKLTSQKAHLDRQIKAIETALGVLGGAQQRDGARGPRRMSAAARRRQAHEGVLGEAPRGRSGEGRGEGVEIANDLIGQRRATPGHTRAVARHAGEVPQGLLVAGDRAALVAGPRDLLTG